MKTALATSIDSSLDWIYANLNFFRLPDYNPEEEQFMDMSRKRFAELALSLSFISESTYWPDDHRVSAMAAFVNETAIASTMHFDLSRNTNLVPYYLVIANGLSSVGREVPGLSYRLQQIADTGFIFQIERCAWNNIDLRYNMDQAGIAHTMPAYDELYGASCLFNFPGLAYIRENDCYAITHLLFYLSDFGKVDLAGVLKDKYERIKHNTGILLGYFTYKQEWDLVAELLMSCSMLNYKDHPLYDVCWEKLLASQNPEGDFTSPFIQDRLGIDSITTAEERFNTNYHTTLVSMFAAISELNTQ